ncbi:hypothetical protein DAPPUDRAFT_105164 [Daphnia pulex]|uniref:Uncharacterized protein n=1 Tax=Daphnia pulex TaxID=6669 RepID=E9GPP9_DAPPU|nr:hypothetical protein DAPPUDRAFT_105164 [Daphnia pulex]|eukprot:EFX78552.1 hypothetical protein DAPPUDRAFT_105164 [Daphnia pulex]
MAQNFSLGEKNHSYHPVFIGDSFNKKQNPTKFTDIDNNCKGDEEGLDKDSELSKEPPEKENRASQEDSNDISKAEKEKCRKRRKRNSECEISDDDIYVDELDEEDVCSKIKNALYM